MWEEHDMFRGGEEILRKVNSGMGGSGRRIRALFVWEMEQEECTCISGCSVNVGGCLIEEEERQT